MQNRIFAKACAGSSNCFRGTREMERKLSLRGTRRLGFREQTVSRSQTNLGPSGLTQIHSSCGAARRHSETIWVAYVSAHVLDFAAKRRYSFKVMQELLRHSSLRSTLDVYTQAISPAKHAAQAAVLALVFASETDTAVIAQTHQIEKPADIKMALIEK